MAIDDLPLPVVNFLNVIGVEWPYINEDTVWQFAGLAVPMGLAQVRRRASDRALSLSKSFGTYFGHYGPESAAHAS
jgi:hypothetical protein